ncbi:MAG: hypothetical protein HDR11_06770 [Lachnospiraceae bacterium]|nr:hypothetical protein [Lachnospiraceae bacterium]
MKLRNKQTCYLKKRVVRTADDGGKYAAYDEQTIELSATVYSGQGQMQEGMAGAVQQYQRKLLMDEAFTITVENKVETYHITDRNGNEFSLAAGDGICLYASPEQQPDYRIAAIFPVGHLKIMLEKI